MAYIVNEQSVRRTSAKRTSRTTEGCLSQGRPDLKVQCLAVVADTGRKTAVSELRATMGACGDGGVRKDA